MKVQAWLSRTEKNSLTKILCWLAEDTLKEAGLQASFAANVRTAKPLAQSLLEGV